MPQDNGDNQLAHEKYKIFKKWLRANFVYVNGYFEQLRVERNEETVQDRTLRRTASANYWIAAFTFVTTAVGIKTYFAVDGQLQVMQGQLAEMKSGSTDTAKLADAAVRQANTAKSQAESLAIVAANARASADAAQKSAEAAAKSVDTSQQLSRPRLIVSSATMTPKGDAVEYSIKNIGSTAGIIRILFTQCIFAESLPLSPVISRSKMKLVQFLISPGNQALTSSDTSLSCPIENTVSIDSLPGGQKAIIFWIVFGYDGYLGRSYSLSTAGVIDPAKGMTRVIGGATYNNEDEEQGPFDSARAKKGFRIEP